MTRQYTLAWNEHDEGGWCCPTLAVYENGMPVRGENGEPIMDRTYLDALKKALRDIRKKRVKLKACKVHAFFIFKLNHNFQIGCRQNPF